MTNTTPQGCEHLDQPYRRLLTEVERYRAIEARLRARCADVERAAVGSGVLGSDLPTHELREAFGWVALPESLDPAQTERRTREFAEWIARERAD